MRSSTLHFPGRRSSGLRPRRHAVAVAVAAALAVPAGLAVSSPASAAVSCRVDYAVASQWSGGFVADVTIANTGDAVNGWTLTWTYGGGQQVTSAWNATVTQSGSAVTARNVGYNGSLASGATASFGFQGTTDGTTNPTPTDFALNGTACDSSAGGSSSTTSTTGSSTTPPPYPLVGWGAQNGGVTGGAGGSSVTVTTASALDTALRTSGPMTITISGMISLTGMHTVTSDKTVQGAGSGSGLSGGGLTMSGASNTIIRNLNFTGSSDDAINVQDSSHNIWIDHNVFSNASDGLVDIRLGSDYITVSWNITRNHDKVMLLGSDDSNTGDRGHLRVTYHHNWFDGTNQRHPRVRFGNPVHVYNNYYANIGSYGVASTTEAGVLVEGNYFENVRRPTALAQGTSPDGNLVQRNNYFVNSGTPVTNGSVNPIPYAYNMDAASSVKSIVTAGAGTGKLGL